MMTARSSDWKVPAVKRLLRDFKEVIAQPLPDVVAHPLEDDLFEWHGNVRGGIETKFAGVPFHFVLVFPSTYPRNAPEIGLYTQLPHPNIVRWKGREARTGFRLALWDCNPTENQWSSAYTVHSILIQIQAFLISEDMMWSSYTVNLSKAVEHAGKLVLQDSSKHTGANPWPAFATEEEIEAAEERAKRQKMVVQKPQNKKVRAGPIWSPPPAQPEPTKKRPPSPATLPVPNSAPSQAVPKKQDSEKEAWQVVKRGKTSSGKQTAKQASNSQSSLIGAVNSLASPSGCNTFGMLCKKNDSLLSKVKNGQVSSNISEDKAVLQAKPTLPKHPLQESKASKKNKARAKKRLEKKQGSEASSEASSSQSTMAESSSKQSFAPSKAPEAPAVPPQSSAKMEQSDGWVTVGVENKQTEKPAKEREADLLKVPHKELLSSVLEEVEREAKEEAPKTAYCKRDPAMGLEMGLFSSLPLDVITTLLTLMSRKEMAVLGATCKGMHACCNDGEIWKLLLERDFSGSKVTAARSTDWKHAYSLQAANVIGDLQCFHSKTSFEDTVLGLPLYFTVNPRTGVVDYIQFGSELLSVAAFKRGVNKPAVTNDLAGDILEVCPVYLNDKHFQEALPYLHQALKTLNPNVPSFQLNPSYWLDTCAKMLNSAVLLLIDKGVEASQKAIHCYCQVHRLMLALAEHFNLWGLAMQRLDDFIRFPSKRNKTTCPNLGWLIAMLAVSPKHNWNDVVIPILLESLDRSVIWACKEHVKLVESFKTPVTAGGEDEQLLDLVFETNRVSRGLIAFHAAFMRTIARPSKLPLEKVMDQADSLYGYASEGQVKHIQSIIKRSQDIKSWEDYCQLIGAQPKIGQQTFKAFMTKQLRQAWENSLQKGYHKKNIDFSRIQASGVSNILLKGQAYSAPPNIKFMEVKDTWKAKTGFVYLDMSLLVYHFDGHRIDTVDFCHLSSAGTQEMGAIRHSGDVHEPHNNFDVGGSSMSQTGHIKFEALGRHVKEIFLVASAYAGRTLADIQQPQIILSDPKTRSVLCEYTLEEQSRDVLKTLTALVMCRIYRDTATSSWKVEAIGDKLKRGYANNYQPIYDHIQKRQATKA